MVMARIKKNDTVKVLSGKDKGKQGTVLQVFPEDGKVMVKGLGIVVRHARPRRQGEVGTIKKIEGFIDLCKVMPVCTACKKTCRINAKQLEDGRRARSCNNCNEII